MLKRVETKILQALHDAREKNLVAQRAVAALKVVVLTVETKAYLFRNDPKALEQVEKAIQDCEIAGILSDPNAGRRYRA